MSWLACWKGKNRSAAKCLSPPATATSSIDPAILDYQEALAAGLPIGSGEIESGHRYVIQARLKIAGAWWKEDNAEKMLAVRVLRANQDWEHYWQNRNQKAA